MGELASWRHRVEEFVLDQVGPLSARVLGVGCGQGQLALARAGHYVAAIDPRAPKGPFFRRVRLEGFSDPTPFDYVATSLSLHHVEGLGRALDKVANLLRAGGHLVIGSIKGVLRMVAGSSLWDLASVLAAFRLADHSGPSQPHADWCVVGGWGPSPGAPRSSQDRTCFQ
jgi:2-polyprenyl-3-methyl-5-hydroxy-6-metoxy-1,4-benzoquinol methylase